MHDPRDVLASARQELAQFPAVLDPLLAALTDAGWRARPAPSEWAPVEIVCHLRDEEAEDFGARVGVLVEGGERFTPVEPERWAVERRYVDADGPSALADFRARRAKSVGALSELTADRLIRGIEHPRIGRLAGLDLLVAWVAHDRLHLAQLAATLARGWADRWAPLRADYAGPIPYAR